MKFLMNLFRSQREDQTSDDVRANIEIKLFEVEHRKRWFHARGEYLDKIYNHFRFGKEKWGYWDLFSLDHGRQSFLVELGILLFPEKFSLSGPQWDKDCIKFNLLEFTCGEEEIESIPILWEELGDNIDDAVTKLDESGFGQIMKRWEWTDRGTIKSRLSPHGEMYHWTSLWKLLNVLLEYKSLHPELTMPSDLSVYTLTKWATSIPNDITREDFIKTLDKMRDCLWEEYNRTVWENGKPSSFRELFDECSPNRITDPIGTQKPLQNF